MAGWLVNDGAVLNAADLLTGRDVNCFIEVDGALYISDGTVAAASYAGVETAGALVDLTDPTKKVAVDASGITTATTRTLTMPDSNVELAQVMRPIADVGHAAAIPVTTSLSMSITTAAAETNTLAIPTFVGQRMILNCDVYAVGDRVVTVASDINVAGNNIMTFGVARDCIELVAIQLAGVLAWEVVWNNNVALSG